MVIWITGLSGSGKTTLCSELFHRMKPLHPELVQLDGDMCREAFGNDLGHTEPERFRHISRVQRIAKLLSDQGLLVLVGVVYANPILLEWNRQHIGGYVEVHLQASMETVIKRESKGFYGRAIRGEIANVVGVDIPWQPPVRPDLVLDGNGGETVQALADRVIAAIPALAQTMRAV